MSVLPKKSSAPVCLDLFQPLTPYGRDKRIAGRFCRERKKPGSNVYKSKQRSKSNLTLFHTGTGSCPSHRNPGHFPCITETGGVPVIGLDRMVPTENLFIQHAEAPFAVETNHALPHDSQKQSDGKAVRKGFSPFKSRQNAHIFFLV